MAASDELVRAGWTLAITLAALFVVAIGIGFWLLHRRSVRVGSPVARQPKKQRANILLVRLDDAVTAGEDELAFAIAQFGSEVTADYERVLTEARSSLTGAFALQQQLDDALPDSEAQRREWTARIIHLCESAQHSLDTERTRFDDLRQLEKNAPANLTSIVTLIDTLDARRPLAADRLQQLRATFAGSAIASVADNLQRADVCLATARASVSSAEAAIGQTSTTTAVDEIRKASDQAHQAAHLLDAIESLSAELDTATDAVAVLVASTRASLDEARHVRDAPPDADSAATIGSAIESAESTLRAVDSSDPIRALDELRDANAILDASLAGARNQQRRLEGARAALGGALVAARSQLSVTRDFIDTRRGSVGSEARTRLAEAERLLMIAEAEADPVAALDVARSSATYSRDADALARYDAH